MPSTAITKKRKRKAIKPKKKKKKKKERKEGRREGGKEGRKEGREEKEKKYLTQKGLESGSSGRMPT
jgi:hypothetical protein